MLTDLGPAKYVVHIIGDQEDDDLDGVMIFTEGLRLQLEEWCRANCRKGWYIGWSHGYFTDVRDAVLFKLFWA